jgi:hypothetical protein
MWFPVTVNAAYLIAKDWMISPARVADSLGVVPRGAAFMLADDVRVLAIVSPAPTPPKKKVQPKNRAGSRAEPIRAHFSRPLIDDANSRIRDVRRRAATCFECDESGHVVRNYPHLPLVASEADAIFNDELEEDALYAAQLQYAMIPGPSHHAMMTTDCVLVFPHEVIFDNVASMSMFENPDLLTDIFRVPRPT